MIDMSQKFLPLQVAYLEREELFLAANAVPKERRVPVFLTLVGGQTYALMKDCCRPQNLPIRL